MIAQQHADLYADLWGSVPNYGDHSPGAVSVGLFRAMSGAVEGSVLDAGCGSGKGAVVLSDLGFGVSMCDLTDEGLTPEARDIGLFVSACLWDDLSSLQSDYVYCCDVLEHIPTEYTMLVLRRLLEASRLGVFLSISLVPDQFGAWVGHPLHLTVQPFTWWRDRLAGMGDLVECRDLGHAGVYFVRPR